MEIITVTHEKQVLEPHITYCAEMPSEAIQDFNAKFGIMPDTVYQKLSINGRSTCYIPAPAHILQAFNSGAFYAAKFDPTT